MYRVIRKNWEKVKYPLISGIFVILILLASVVYKSNDQIIKNTKNVNIQYQSPDIETFKKFIMKQIRSPFTNINYDKTQSKIIINATTSEIGKQTFTLKLQDAHKNHHKETFEVLVLVSPCEETELIKEEETLKKDPKKTNKEQSKFKIPYGIPKFNKN